MSIAKKNILTIAIGSVIILTTILSYIAMPYPKTQTSVLIFCIVMFSETVALSGFVLLNKIINRSKIMLSAGCYSSLLIYFLASVSASVLYAVYFQNAANLYIILEILLFAVLLIVLILLYTGYTSIASEDKQILYQAAAFKTTLSNMDLIKDNPKNQKYHQQLTAIYDELSGCDNSTYIKTDEIISEKIYDLNVLLQTDNQGKQTLELVDEIIQLVKRRNLEVSQLKMGGI